MGSTFRAQWGRCCPGDYIPCSFHIQFFKKSNGMCTNGSEILFLWSRILYEVGNIPDVHLQRAGQSLFLSTSVIQCIQLKHQHKLQGEKRAGLEALRAQHRHSPNSSNLLASFTVNSGKSSHEHQTFTKMSNLRQRSSIIGDDIC